MAYFICLETTTTNCSVALYKGSTLLLLKEDKTAGYSHAEQLHVFMEQLLKEEGIGFDEVAAIAVSEGPGSYTGLRIGVSAAKGLCYALGIPLIAIPTLAVLARQVAVQEGLIVPMLDARRMEVYSAIFDANYSELAATEALILDENSFSEYLNKGTVYFIGNGVSKFKAICTHPNAMFIEDALPSSKEMGAFAPTLYATKTFKDIAYFEPFYLKAFHAG